MSLADKVHNVRAIGTDMRTIGPAVFDRFKGGKDGTIWYYSTLAGIFERLYPGALADELCDAVQRMDTLASSPTIG